MNVCKLRVLIVSVGILIAPLSAHSKEAAGDSSLSLEILIKAKPKLKSYLEARRSLVSQLVLKYGRVIDVRLNNAADAGDLKTVEAFQGEKEQLVALGKVYSGKVSNVVEEVREQASLPDLDKSSPDALMALRKIWSIEWKKIRSKLDGELQQSLKNIEIQFTKARDFKSANQVLTFRKSLPSGKNVELDSATQKPSPGNIRNGSILVGKRSGAKKVNGMGIELRWIVPGGFTMGSPLNELGRKADREAQIEVELTNGYWIGAFEVTQGEYEAVMGINPSYHKQDGNRKPVEQVSWTDAKEFCRKLTELERENGKLAEGWSYTLPTEYQWEYACRAGSEGSYYSQSLDKAGWYKGNGNGGSREVGKREKNKWGLHDMHGNIREWCLNWYVSNPLGGKNPKLPDSGTGRTHKGGSWLHPAEGCRSADREGSPVGYKSPRVGFRVALVVVEN